jgi:steroid delta-isomerase-like uncharacterized protein
MTAPTEHRQQAGELLRRHQDALNRHDVPALVALYSDDAVLISPMFETVTGREAIGRSFERLFTIFPDYSIQMSDALSLFEGDRAAEFSTVTATHQVELFGLPPTGQRIEYHAARLFTLRGGQIAYEQRIYDFGGVLERLEKTRTDRELGLAKAVQAALCRTRHEGTFFEAVGSSLPCRAIGGDFLEYLNLPDGRLGVAVGDVSGKGPAAALVAAMLQGMFSMVAADGGEPSETLTRLNTALCRRGIEPRFATLTYVTIASNGRLTYANAGHHPPLLLASRGVTRLTEGGPMLGLFEHAVFPEASLDLAHGDTLVAFSDGITDALAPDGSDFGMDRLLTIAGAHRTERPPELLARLLGTVEAFVGLTPPNDDVTVAVVRYR